VITLLLVFSTRRFYLLLLLLIVKLSLVLWTEDGQLDPSTGCQDITLLNKIVNKIIKTHLFDWDWQRI